MDNVLGDCHVLTNRQQENEQHRSRFATYWNEQF